MELSFTTQLGSLEIVLALTAFLLVVFSQLLRSKQGKIIKLLLLRLSILGLIVLALLGPQLSEKTAETQTSVPVLLDISDSMNSNHAQRCLDKLIQQGLSETLELFPFAGEVAPVSEESMNFEEIRRKWSKKISSSATNIAIALEQLNKDRQVVLITDGYDTENSEDEIKQVALKSDGQIYFCRPSRDLLRPQTPSISQISAPLVSEPNSKLVATLLINNRSDREHDIQTVVKVNEKEICVERSNVGQGSDISVECEFDFKEKITTIIGEIWNQDRSQLIDSRTTFTSPQTRGKVVVLSGSKSDFRYLGSILKQANIPYDSLVSPLKGGIPKTSFDKYSVIILNNISRKQLSDPNSYAIKQVVENGAGFVSIGGVRGYGLGGYIKSPIEDLFAVKLIPPTARKKRLNVAMALVIDKSGSMAKNYKLLYSKAAAKEVVRNLKDQDYITIIGFDSSPFLALPIGRVAEQRSKSIERIDRLHPAGTSLLPPALEVARKSLEAVPAGQKHIIILSDGEVSGSDTYYNNLANDLRTGDITVSAVYVGTSSPTKLNIVTQVSGGSFYQTYNSTELPRILVQDTKIYAGERTLKESVDFPIRVNRSALRSTSLTNYPALKGFVETDFRPDASQELTVGTLGKFKPLLASIRKEGRKLVSFTSDINGIWSKNWIRWKEVTRFWSELIESVTNKSFQREPIKFDLRYFPTGNGLQLELLTFSEIEQDYFDIKLASNEKKALSFSTRMESKARGRYEGKIDSIQGGEYSLSFSGLNRVWPNVKIFLPQSQIGEQQNQGLNLGLLKLIADLTGGKESIPAILDLPKNSLASKTNFSLVGWLSAVVTLLLGLNIWFREKL